MFSASQLTQEQKDLLHQIAAEGGTMADLQRAIKERFGFSITYMDTRFLVLDLGIQLLEEPKPAEKTPEDDPLAPQGTPGEVQVSLDQLALPGALVSGKVTFRDGQQAIWMLDQTGRLGLDPDTPGYRPSPEDAQEFQSQLRRLLETSGY